MSEPRRPTRPTYDAAMGFATLPMVGDYPVVYALIKFTLEIRGGVCVPAPAEPLFHNIHDETLKPRFKEGTDYWPWKQSTDFVVRGSAFAPDGSPTRSMAVSARIGNHRKQIRVSGRRVVEWAGGEVAWVPPPEPFLEMPLTYANAYGGIDFRVGPWEPGRHHGWGAEVDHPGLNPRNPFGKGYVVLPGDVPGTEMPNLEDPSQLLTAENLVTRDPKSWYRQPLPWCFDWVHVMTFPRYIFFHAGVDAWFPGPEDERMPEVQRGYCPANYRTLMAERTTEYVHPRFHQEGSYGFVLDGIGGGESVSLKGMHPAEPTLRFELPAPLRTLEFDLEGKLQTVKPRIHQIVCRPAEKIVTMTYAAEVKSPRLFIAGIHKTIPIAIRVNGDTQIPYDTPPTVRDTIAEAQAKPQPPLPWETFLP